MRVVVFNMVTRVGLLLEVTFVRRLEEERALDKWVFVEKALQIMCRPLSHCREIGASWVWPEQRALAYMEGHEVKEEMERDGREPLGKSHLVQTAAQYRRLWLLLGLIGKAMTGTGAEERHDNHLMFCQFAL